MIIDRLEVYGAAGGSARTALVTAHIEASQCDTVAEVSGLIGAAPDLLAAARAALCAPGFSGELIAISRSAYGALRAAVEKAHALSEP